LINGQIEITTGFPSAAKAAKKLGVSKKVARDLHLLAERSLKTGEFVLPGVGRLVRVSRKSRQDQSVKLPATKVVKLRVAKQPGDAIAATKKK
jgi:hypothetical protein